MSPLKFWLTLLCKRSWMAVAIVKNESQSVSIITLTWQQMTAYSCTSVRVHSDYTSQLMLRILMWLWWLSEGWENSQCLHLEDFFLLVLAVVLELTLVTLFCLFVCFFFQLKSRFYCWWCQQQIGTGMKYIVQPDH